MGEIVRDAVTRLHDFINSGYNANRTYRAKTLEEIDPKFHSGQEQHTPATHKRENEDRLFQKLFERPAASVEQFYRLAKIPGVREKINLELGRNSGDGRKTLPRVFHSARDLPAIDGGEAVGYGTFRNEHPPLIDETDHYAQVLRDAHGRQSGLFYAAVDAIKDIQNRLHLDVTVFSPRKRWKSQAPNIPQIPHYFEAKERANEARFYQRQQQQRTPSPPEEEKELHPQTPMRV